MNKMNQIFCVSHGAFFAHILNRASVIPRSLTLSFLGKLTVCIWVTLLIWFPALIPIGQGPVASLANFPLSCSLSSTQEAFRVLGWTAHSTLSKGSSPQAEELAQLVKGLSHRHEDLGLIPKTHIKSQWCVVCNHSTGGADRRDPWGSLSSQSCIISEFRPARDHVSK